MGMIFFKRDQCDLHRELISQWRLHGIATKLHEKENAEHRSLELEGTPIRVEPLKRVPGRSGSCTAQNGACSQQDDLQVKPEAPVFDIRCVEGDVALEGGILAGPHLPQTR